MDQQAAFKKRRLELHHQLGREAIAVIPAAPEVRRNADAYFRYRQDSDFYYLTGFTEPEAVAVFAPGSPHGDYVLFCRDKDPTAEVWHGRRAGLQGAKEIYGADAAFPIADLDHRMPELMQGRSHLHYHYGQESAFDQRLMNWMNALRARIRKGGQVPENLNDLGAITQELRLFKQPEEIAAMRAAARISAAAHLRAMQYAKRAHFEYELEAELLHEFYRHGCRAPAYDSIVASGENACILHYTDNHSRLDDQALILIDAGAEFQHYAADITRTFPKSGRFTSEQRALYEVVLRAQLAALALAKPGTRWNELQAAIVTEMVDGLVDLGVFRGSRDELIENKTYEKVYMHSSGHWLGLDVHDVGRYKINDEWRSLEPNMVLTIEPGIYIASDTPGIEERWWGIGIRIEDDVLITPNGHEVFSEDVPKAVDQIQAVMV